MKREESDCGDPSEMKENIEEAQTGSEIMFVPDIVYHRRSAVKKLAEWFGADDPNYRNFERVFTEFERHKICEITEVYFQCCMFLMNSRMTKRSWFHYSKLIRRQQKSRRIVSIV
jgi:hypothetical protein